MLWDECLFEHALGRPQVKLQAAVSWLCTSHHQSAGSAVLSMSQVEQLSVWALAGLMLFNLHHFTASSCRLAHVVQTWGCWTCCSSRASCRGCCCTRWRWEATAGTPCCSAAASPPCSARLRTPPTPSTSPSTPWTTTGYAPAPALALALAAATAQAILLTYLTQDSGYVPCVSELDSAVCWFNMSFPDMRQQHCRLVLTR